MCAIYDYWAKLTLQTAYNLRNNNKRECREILVKEYGFTEEAAKREVKYW